MKKRILNFLSLAGTKILQALFPARCPVCDGIVTPRGEKICVGCLKKLRPITSPWCMKCGKKLVTDGEYCEDCKKTEHLFERGRALYEYSSVMESIYRFKYGGRQEYADFFGEAVSVLLGDFIRSVKPDALIPIPLHKKRLHKRGYNQALLLAKQVGKRCGIRVETDALVRIKNTEPLKTLNLRKRQNNLKKAFIMEQNEVKLKRVILVDDIYTTGSTMDEAARALYEAGVEKIYFITIACGDQKV